MTIRGISSDMRDAQLHLAAHEQSTNEVKPTPSANKKEATGASNEPNRPAHPPRRPALAHVVNQGLVDAGVHVANKSAVPATDKPQDTQSSNDLEKAQSEKVAQALQAFMHSLVQASTKDENTGPDTSAAVTSPSLEQAPRAVSGTSGASSAYTGLVSQLDELARGLDGGAIASETRPAVARLESAFRDLLSVSSENPSTETATPTLQQVLRNIARNLQSTGNPNLATTGNVINTSA